MLYAATQGRLLVWTVTTVVIHVCCWQCHRLAAPSVLLYNLIFLLIIIDIVSVPFSMILQLQLRLEEFPIDTCVLVCAVHKSPL